jgi:predicted enzyme related to lactoylglutathione lyase
MDETKILSINMASVYAEDYDTCFTFYHDVLGLEGASPTGSKSCYFSIGKNQGLYLEGGYEPSEADIKTARTTFTLEVGSAKAMFEKLKKKGIRTIQKEPMKMAENIFWFQCFDPCGNMVEFIGGE